MASLPAMIDPQLSLVGDEPQPEPGINIEELVDALKREAESADTAWDKLRPYVDAAHDFYEARPFGNEVEGRSQIVLPDVQEAVDYMIVSVLRAFVSGDRVVEFEATDESDEQGTDEATAAVDHAFMRQQDGYRILHDWLMSGLLEKLGVVETIVTDEERVVRERVTISDPVELEGFTGEVEDAEDNGDGTYTLSLRQDIKKKRFIDESVPLEEFRFSARARHEDDADYLARCPVVTRSDLVDMGFDRDQVYALPVYTATPEVRRGDDREGYDPDPESTKALQPIQLFKEYARIDMDGDGIAERVKTYRVEDEILRWADKSNPHPQWGDMAIEIVDEQPFSVFCPFPKPNRLVGYSFADKVMDIQLGRSTVARQLFDGLYQGNMPRPIVVTRGMDENTIDDLLSPIAGAPIRVADVNGVVPFQNNFDVGKSLTVMEWMTGERESRTGITRLNQGMNADTLNTNTATAFRGLQEQGQQQEEFIARNFAEAFSRLMAKKYRLMRREGEPFNIKVDGQYKRVDPGQWPEDVNLSIRVGLGTGSKDKRVMARMQLAPFLAEGFQNGVVSPKNLFHAIDGLVRDLGIGKGSDFWKDPEAPPQMGPDGQPIQEPEQPDPEMEAMKAEQQREDARFQAEQQRTAAQLQLKRDEAAANLQALRERHSLELAQKREQAALDAELARERADDEAALAIYRTNKEAEVKAYAISRKAETDADIGQNREGGRLDA